MAQSHTPRSSCVRFVAVVTAGSRNTRLQAARYALPGLDLHQPIAPASWRLPLFRRKLSCERLSGAAAEDRGMTRRTGTRRALALLRRMDGPRRLALLRQTAADDGKQR